MATTSVTDAEISEAFKGKNFATTQHRDYLERSVLKVATGFGCGHTITVMMVHLGLIRGSLASPQVTARGKKFMRESASICRFIREVG